MEGKTKNGDGTWLFPPFRLLGVGLGLPSGANGAGNGQFVAGNGQFKGG